MDLYKKEGVPGVGDPRFKTRIVATGVIEVAWLIIMRFFTGGKILFYKGYYGNCESIWSYEY